ncbi:MULTISPECIES: hypothetical protein [unclassified Streptomyces]|uniref:hypothetical protein n=1 Tax=unclassified Streptomyces TaxID=2593676 RepID=UPI002E2E0856|nr:hypothetical protein [Streptomyces sp. NBC_01429]
MPAGEVVPAATGPGTIVAADVQLLTETGECPGEDLVLAHGGYPKWLEARSSNDEIEVNPGAARRGSATEFKFNSGGLSDRNSRMLIVGAGIWRGEHPHLYPQGNGDFRRPSRCALRLKTSSHSRAAR